MEKGQMVIVGIGTILFIWFFCPLLAKGLVNIGGITGMAVSLLVILYGIFRSRINHRLAMLWETGGGRTVLLLLLGAVVAAVLVVLAETVLMVRAAYHAPPQNTTAVVLGCSVKGTRPSAILEERLEAAYDYLSKNPEALCILSGGQGEGEDISEAECMHRYLTERGIDAKRLILETASTTTEENLRFSRELLNERGLGRTVTIITSEFHAYRAEKTAERLGLTAYSTPARTCLLYLPTYYLRELYGILYYELVH